MILYLENPKDATKQLLENSSMNLVKLQDTKLIYRNLLYFHTLTMNYQKSKLRKQSHLQSCQRVHYVKINPTKEIKENWKWKSLSHVWHLETPWTIQPMEFSRPEYCSGQPFPSPGDFPNPGIKPRSPALQVDSLSTEPQGKPKNTGVGSLSLLQWIFLTQESNWSLLHCRWILYHLGSKRTVLKKTVRCWWKKFRKTATDGKTYHVLRLDELILLIWLYYMYVVEELNHYFWIHDSL